PVGVAPERHGRARGVLPRVRQGLLHYPFAGRSGDLGGNLPGDFDVHAHARVPGSAHHRLEVEPDWSATVDRVFGTQDSEALMQSIGRGDRAGTDVRRSLALLLTGPGQDFERPAVNGDESKVVADEVVHVLGDACAFPRPCEIGDHRSLLTTTSLPLLQCAAQPPR